MVFARLHYPETLIENAIRNFIEMRVTENMCSRQQVSDEQDSPSDLCYRSKTRNRQMR